MVSHYKCIPFSLPSALIHPHTKHTNTQTHRLTHTHTHTNTHTHIHTQTHTLTHTHSQAHTHTQTHTHTSTHTSHTPSFLAHRDATLLQCIASLFTALTNSCATHCLFAQGRFSKWNSLPLFSLRLPIYVPQTVFPHREGFPSEIPCLSHCCAYQFTCNTDTLILTGRLPSIHLPALLSCPPIAHTLRVDQKLYMTLCTCVRI